MTSVLLLDGLGFDRFNFDGGAGFGFDVAKTFVVVGIEAGGGLIEVVEFALLVTRACGRRDFATRGGNRSVPDAGDGGATTLALVDAVGLHHAFVTLSTSDVSA